MNFTVFFLFIFIFLGESVNAQLPSNLVPMLWIHMDYNPAKKDLNIDSHVVLSPPPKLDRNGTHPNPSARFNSVPLYDKKGKLRTSVEIENMALVSFIPETEPGTSEKNGEKMLSLKNYSFTLRIPIMSEDEFANGYQKNREILRQARLAIEKNKEQKEIYQANPTEENRKLADKSNSQAIKKFNSAFNELVAPAVNQIFGAFNIKDQSEEKIQNFVKYHLRNHFLNPQVISAISNETIEILAKLETKPKGPN